MIVDGKDVYSVLTCMMYVLRTGALRQPEPVLIHFQIAR